MSSVVMARNKGFGRRQKGSRHSQKQAPQPKGIPTNSPDPPDNRPTEDKGKDPPHPTFLPKEPNPSINLDCGNLINTEECGNRNNERRERNITEPPTSTQISTIQSTPKKHYSNVPRPTTRAKDITNSRSMALNYAPISEINTAGSFSSSLSSMTASPSLNVRSIQHLITEESKHSKGQETDALKFLHQLKSVEEQQEKLDKQRADLYAIANENQRLHDMLTSKNNMLDDYISDKHVSSTLSN